MLVNKLVGLKKLFRLSGRRKSLETYKKTNID